MQPAKVDLPTIWRGCHWGPVILKWKDQLGHPIDLSGWLPRAHTLNINLHPIITDQPGGVTVMQLSKTETANVKLGTENWDWIWERTGDAPLSRYPPFLAGKVVIKEPLTTNGSTPP